MHERAGATQLPLGRCWLDCWFINDAVKVKNTYLLSRFVVRAVKSTADDKMKDMNDGKTVS